MTVTDTAETKKFAQKKTTLLAAIFFPGYLHLFHHQATQRHYFPQPGR